MKYHIILKESMEEIPLHRLRVKKLEDNGLRNSISSIATDEEESGEKPHVKFVFILEGKMTEIEFNEDCEKKFLDMEKYREYKNYRIDRKMGSDCSIYTITIF